MNLLLDRFGSLLTPPRRVIMMPRPPTIFHEEPYGGSPILSVISVNMCIQENGNAHKTSRYDLMNRRDAEPSLVVRRGQAFYLDLTLSRDYNPSTDGISIAFTLDGVEGMSRNISYIVLAVQDSGIASATSWQATIKALKRNWMRIEIVSSASSLVGKWNIDIDTKFKQRTGGLCYDKTKPIYIIFNPWCKDDTVYLDDEAKRREYVLADQGRIWRGSMKRLESSSWAYAQYEKNILDCALVLMNVIGKTDVYSRGDPIVICRNLTAAVNDNDSDGGVLMGGWDNNYVDGVAPWKWQGSREILQRFYEYGKTIKYGQCWVYGGVLATICRALGIPCRVVTNYESAHDVHRSLTVDRVYDVKGVEIMNYPRDAIWNHHVWNEAWMTRPDLGADYDGWQAIDATPQEISDGQRRCGPASVNAVKKGEVNRPYDTNFVYGEVNADVVRWRYKGDDQPLKLLSRSTKSVGWFISTKAVGSMEREDITHEYKHPEGSKDERDTMVDALRKCQSSFSRYCLNEEFSEIDFKFEIPQNLMFGEPLSIDLVMRNKNTGRDYGLSVNMNVDAVTYDAKTSTNIGKWPTDCTVKAGNIETVKFDLHWNDYGIKLSSRCTLKITCMVAVHGTTYEYFSEIKYQFKKPEIKIELKSQPRDGEELRLTARFKNFLPRELTEGTFQISGFNNEPLADIPVWNVVYPGEDVTCDYAMLPNRAGDMTLNMIFYSNLIDDIKGSVNFTVEPAMNNYVYGY